MDGDCFVIFFASPLPPERLEEKSRQIQNRLREMQLPGFGAARLGFTAALCPSLPGDRYRELFERTARQLLSADQPQDTGEARSAEELLLKKGLSIDMKLIRKELAEQKLIPGAYCQDYDSFKSIYRFMERRLRRTKSSACIILVTLTDGEGNFPPLSERAEQMSSLQDVIQCSLRLGDVFTRYSSCQYLIMVPDADPQDADKIALRICKNFYSSFPVRPKDILLHHCYPLFSPGSQQ